MTRAEVAPNCHGVGGAEAGARPRPCRALWKPDQREIAREERTWVSRVALIGGWDSCWCVRVQAAVSPSRGRLPIGCLARFVISAGRVMMQELVGHDFHLHFCFFISAARQYCGVFFSGAVSSLHKSARRQVTASLRTQELVDHELESFSVSAPGIWYAGV